MVAIDAEKWPEEATQPITADDTEFCIKCNKNWMISLKTQGITFRLAYHSKSNLYCEMKEQVLKVEQQSYCGERRRKSFTRKINFQC